MMDIIPIVVLAIASYRLTRFIVIDSLVEGLRNKIYSFLVNKAQKEGKLSLLWHKVYELGSCTWCAGFWVSAGLYWVYVWTSPFEWSRLDAITVLAIAGIQGMIHALEPDDE